MANPLASPKMLATKHEISQSFAHHYRTSLVLHQKQCKKFSLNSTCYMPKWPDGRTSERNSARVSFCRKQPTIADVTVDEFCFSIPRIIMHRCRASITTPTPCGAIAS